MKIFISADIEGVCGVTARNEVVSDAVDDYAPFQKQMTREIAAACEGAFEAGAREIVIKDAHGSARNIIASGLPADTKLIRGWSGHPYSMMDGLDRTFDAVMMIGYHAKAGDDGNPLAHSFNSAVLSKIKINGVAASEMIFNWYIAALEEVPLVFLSGDKKICEESMEIVPQIRCTAVKECVGGSTINIHPDRAIATIKEGARLSLADGIRTKVPELPEWFEIEIEYLDFKPAYKASFYPGARQTGKKTILFETDSYFDVLRMMRFVYE